MHHKKYQPPGFVALYQPWHWNQEIPGVQQYPVRIYMGFTSHLHSCAAGWLMLVGHGPGTVILSQIPRQGIHDLLRPSTTRRAPPCVGSTAAVRVQIRVQILVVPAVQQPAAFCPDYRGGSSALI